jgi:ketosteroid isomerase-like protein
MEMPQQLPRGVRRVLEATNAGDADAFVAAFTEDGAVDDWGRTFRGREEIARWDAGENTGVHAHVEVQGWHAQGDTATVSVAVTGGGFTGTSTFTFETDGDLVRSMRITG